MLAGDDATTLAPGSAGNVAPDDAQQALDLAYKKQEEGDDEEAFRWAQNSLRLRPEGNMAKVLVQWLERFGKGSEVDTAVRRVLRAPDFYAVLGLKRFTQPDAETHKGFLRLSRMLHPDKSGARRTEEACKRVNEAYTTLKDAQKRAKYDARLLQQRRTVEEQQRRSGVPAENAGQPAAAASSGGGCGTARYDVREQLRRAISTVPTVGELRWILDQLGAGSNSRVRDKLIGQILVLQRRSKPTHPPSPQVPLPAHVG